MGSEMCIRDRRYAASAACILALGTLTGCLTTASAAAASHAHAWLCLLYTSDAADERSSVDLGGRRILKKKNTAGWLGVRSRR